MTDTMKLQDAAAELVNRITDFAGDQLPEVAQQLLAWEQTRLTYWLVFDWLLVAALAAGLVWAWRWAIKNRELDELMLALMMATGFWLIWLIVSVDGAFALAKVITAPKVWLLEYGADLLRHASPRK